MTTRRRPPRGFTIIEVLVAIILLAVGLVSLAALGPATMKLAAGGALQTAATAAAEARFDSLASLPCTTLAANGATTQGSGSPGRRIREHWVVTDGTNIKRLLDTLWLPNRTRPLVYQNVLPCRE
jgi:prepilin-type N-terminal cleavage/methylation domain-containing protein